MNYRYRGYCVYRVHNSFQRSLASDMVSLSFFLSRLLPYTYKRFLSPRAFRFVSSCIADGRLLFILFFSSPLPTPGPIHTYMYQLQLVAPSRRNSSLTFVLPWTAPTHERLLYSSRSTCQHALRVISFDERKRERGYYRARSPCAREARIAIALAYVDLHRIIITRSASRFP